MRLRSAIVAVVSLSLAGAAASVHAVDIQMVTVGNPGNTGENSGGCVPGGYGGCRTCGEVQYVYNIGTFEITAGEYTEFLNAVADEEDIYGLYKSYMWSTAEGCKIERNGTSGSYTYTVAGDWSNRPVNYVSWGDAARFCNWMHNGQPTGAQGLSTTEDGSYYLNGAMSDDALIAVVREPDATWVIPSEDEWYKAAYHKNDGVTGNYFDYPTSSDSVPSNDLIDPDPGNNANFDDDGGAIGSPYFRTVAGDFENSDSPYGTFDQGGNVWEWNDIVHSGMFRSSRGGSYVDAMGVATLHAAFRYFYVQAPSVEYKYNGFRIANVSAYVCGNGLVEPGEECDDDNTQGGEGCSSTCMVENGWECTGEPSACTEIVCGDGLLGGDEECDDDNTQGGEGCSSTCMVENGWECTGEPSACAEICGDGIIVGSEGCDDDNAHGGDGCSPTCRVEVGWECTGAPSVCTLPTSGIPAVSEWGLIVLTLLAMVLATIMLARRRGLA
ncbi:MAG: DUF4215 domain-containing protein [Planctomycetota bacterium]